jgi:hypothetical protein
VRLAGMATLLAGAALAASLVAPGPARARAELKFTRAPTQPALPAGDRLVAVAELTGDGIADLVVENPEGSSIGVMAGTGAATFAAPSSIALRGRPVGVQVADFNDDGRPDLVVPIETKATPRPLNLLAEHVQILLGDGAGGFTVGALLALPERGPVYVGDFNGDGTSDLAVGPDGCWGEANASKYNTLLGDGHGNLAPPRTTIDATRGCRGEIGDFNHDGRADLATYSPGGLGSSGEVTVLPGDAGGGFGSPIVTPAPAGSFYIAGVADLDGNGSLDLVMALFTEPSTFAVLLGNGAGGFTPSSSYASGAPHLGFTAAMGDFNGDGRVDIAAIAYQIDLLENTGAGAFAAGPVTPLSESYEQAFAADVNRDGRQDLVLAGLSNAGVFLNEAVPPPSTAQAPARERTSLRARLRLSRGAHRAARSVHIGGTLRLADGAVPAGASCKGRVRVRITLRHRTLARASAVLTGRCAFQRTLRISSRALAARRKPTVIITFAGNSKLLPASLRERA